MSTYLSALRAADGLAATPDADGFVTLESEAETYFFAASIRDFQAIGVQIETDGDLEAVFTIEDTNITESRVTDWDDSDAWVPENPDPATVYVAITDSAGWTADGLTLTKVDTAAGSAVLNISGIGTRRLRVRAAVSSDGKARVSFHGKL